MMQGYGFNRNTIQIMYEQHVLDKCVKSLSLTIYSFSIPAKSIRNLLTYTAHRLIVSLFTALKAEWAGALLSHLAAQPSQIFHCSPAVSFKSTAMRALIYKAETYDQIPCP
jgi:hypothetical protein